MLVSLTPIKPQFHIRVLLQPQHVLSIDHINVMRRIILITAIFDVNGELVFL
jgi:hypothetical protein